jgi:T5orf172 domain
MFEAAAQSDHHGSHGGFVYLLALTDCTAFKVGFTCNPLQRIHGFSRRYFEHFDLQQSQILALEHAAAARAVETRLKHELAPHRSQAPAWLPEAAGGHTEWFSAVHFTDALALVEGHAAASDDARCLSAFALLRGELLRRCREFEIWAWQSALELAGQQLHTANAAHAASALRDWLDAYRYCDVPLFLDDPAAASCVFAAVRRS